MLTGREIAEYAARRGVPEVQIRLDELVSHILAAPKALRRSIVGFGLRR